MGLGQSVWQTITQSLAQTSPTSLGSAFGRITSSPSLSQASRVAELPPTDPKWQYPPLPELPVRARLPQSRPQATSSLGKRRAPFADGQQHREKVQRADSASLPASAPLPTPKSVDKPSEAEKDELDTVIRGSPRHRTSVAAQPCHLSDEDIQHITTLLERTGMSLEQIWETKVAWRKWPLRIFRQHYLQHSREEIDLNSEEAPFSLPGEGFCQTPETHVPTPRPFSEKDFASLSPIKSSVETLRKSRRTRKQPAPVSEIQNCDASHLPTPNLTSHSGETDTEKDNDQGEPTSSHTDEEDDPGLQVATGDEPLIEHDEPIMTSPPPEELVIPSIENDDPQDDSQDELLEPQCPIKYPRVEVRIPRVKPPAPDRNDTFIPQSSPPRCEPPVANTTADSDSDIDLVPTVLPVEAEATDSEKTAPDMNDDDEQVDELAAPFIPSTPITPRIKREPVSPELSSLLTVPRPSTPISAPQLSRPDSSGSKSTSRLSKSHIARLARAQWAKQGRSGTPLRAKQRRSLGEALPRRAGQEDSDDELAM